MTRYLSLDNGQKKWVDLSTSSDSVYYKKITLSASEGVSSKLLLSANSGSKLVQIRVTVITAFNGTPTISFGTDANNIKYVNLSAIADSLFFISAPTLLGPELTKLFYTAGGATVGQCEIDCFYIDATLRTSINVQDVGYDLILSIGASNNYFGEGLDLNYDFPDSRILQYPSIGTYQSQIIQAVEPLYHHQLRENAIGPFVAFAKQYLSIVPNNRKVLILPCALSGVGLGDNNWNPGDAYYNFAVSQTNNALSTNSNNRLKLIYYPAHGPDRGLGIPEVRQRIINLINGLRTEITNAANVPFFISGVSSSSIANEPDRQPYADLLKIFPTITLNTYYVPIEDLPTADGIHWIPSSQRKIADRMFDIYKNIA